jgi:hypothetical protein
MAHSSLGLSRRRWAAIFFATAALAIGACSSPSTGPWFGGGDSLTQALTRRPPSTTPTPQYTFQRVNYLSVAEDEVTDVNSDLAIVGTYFSGNQYNSFTAQCTPGPGNGIDCSKPGFTPAPYNSPNAGVYLNASINANGNNGRDRYDVGYVILDNSYCKTCGVLHDEETNAYTLIKNPNQGSGDCAVTELLGINGSKIAVGYYETGTGSPCKYHAFEWYQNTYGPASFVDLNVPNAVNSKAWGISNAGDVVGTAHIVGSGVNVDESWYYNDFNYTRFYVGNQTTSATTARDINWDGGIVGDYTDSGVQRGFLLVTQKRQLSTSPAFETLNYPSNTGTAQTIVNGIDFNWVIAGWYWQNASYTTHGFVGNCVMYCPLTSGTGGDSRLLRSSRRAGARGRLLP